VPFEGVEVVEPSLTRRRAAGLGRSARAEDLTRELSVLLVPDIPLDASLRLPHASFTLMGRPVR
jgi:hypothetical protein